MEYAAAVKKGKFEGSPEKHQLLFIVIKDWNYYGYYKPQPSLFQQLTPGWDTVKPGIWNNGIME